MEDFYKEQKHTVRPENARSDIRESIPRSSAAQLPYPRESGPMPRTYPRESGPMPRPLSRASADIESRRNVKLSVNSYQGGGRHSAGGGSGGTRFGGRDGYYEGSGYSIGGGRRGKGGGGRGRNGGGHGYLRAIIKGVNAGLALAIILIIGLGIYDRLQMVLSDSGHADSPSSVTVAQNDMTDMTAAGYLNDSTAVTTTYRKFAVWDPTKNKPSDGGYSESENGGGNDGNFGDSGVSGGDDSGGGGHTGDGGTADGGSDDPDVGNDSGSSDGADANSSDGAASSSDGVADGASDASAEDGGGPAGGEVETVGNYGSGDIRFGAADFGLSGEESGWITNLMNANHTRSVLETTSNALYPDGGSILDWPVEPRYIPLAHDYYLVSSGAAKVAGFTHNNEQIRKKHYVYITGRSHYGFDITAVPGTTVRSAAAGTVIGVYENYKDSTGTSDYGRYMVIDHGSALSGLRTFTLYAHLSATEVSVGARVEKGDVIAYSGNSGGSRIPHLHFEVRIGENSHAANINPLEALPARDLRNLESLPSVAEGFPQSSVELYQRMVASDWSYDVYVRSSEARAFHNSSLPAGTRLLLKSRSDSNFSAAVEHNGIRYTYPLSSLEFTYN